MSKRTAMTGAVVGRASSTCTALKPSGAFCDRDSLPDAPFPICVRHAADVMRFVNSHLTETPAALAAAYIEPAVDVEQVAVPIPGDGVPVVYYVLVGEHIKIGYSANLYQRIRFYPPDATLLAYEPGEMALERQRLYQFRATLAYAMEWFRPSVQLIKHINSLRDMPLEATNLAA